MLPSVFQKNDELVSGLLVKLLSSRTEWFAIPAAAELLQPDSQSDQ